MHGRGIMIWPDSRTYEGEFKFGNKEGFGCYKFKDGSKFMGEFKDDE